MSLLNTTTTTEFEEQVINSKKVVLVDFWAEWCPPCRAMAPTLQTLSEKMEKQIDIVKVNTEASADNSKIAGKYEVQSIPNLQIFKDGKVVDQIIGMVPEKVLEETLAKHL